MSDYQTVFDITTKSYKEFVFQQSSVLIITGFSLFLFYAGIRESMRLKMWYKLLLPSPGLLIIVFVFVRASDDLDKLKIIMKAKTYNVVEGKVSNFSPMPANGHGIEEFSVSNVHFKYKDNSTPGYNKTLVHGGLISNDSQVKISYIQLARI